MKRLAKCLFEYSATCDEELSISEGDLVVIDQQLEGSSEIQTSDGWVKSVLFQAISVSGNGSVGSEGLVPVNYLELMQSLPGKFEVLYDYQSQNEFELSLEVDDSGKKFQVFCNNDDGWSIAYSVEQDKFGFVPTNYFSISAAAQASPVVSGQTAAVATNKRNFSDKELSLFAALDASEDQPYVDPLKVYAETVAKRQSIAEVVTGEFDDDIDNDFDSVPVKNASPTPALMKPPVFLPPAQDTPLVYTPTEPSTATRKFFPATVITKTGKKTKNRDGLLAVDSDNISFLNERDQSIILEWPTGTVTKISREKKTIHLEIESLTYDFSFKAKSDAQEVLAFIEPNVGKSVKTSMASLPITVSPKVIHSTAQSPIKPVDPPSIPVIPVVTSLPRSEPPIIPKAPVDTNIKVKESSPSPRKSSISAAAISAPVANTFVHVSHASPVSPPQLPSRPQLPAREIIVKLPPSPQKLEISPVEIQQPVAAPVEQELAIALYDYVAVADGELTINENDQIAILDASDPEWTKVELVSGLKSIGFVPATYIAKTGARRESRTTDLDARPVVRMSNDNSLPVIQPETESFDNNAFWENDVRESTTVKQEIKPSPVKPPALPSRSNNASFSDMNVKPAFKTEEKNDRTNLPDQAPKSAFRPLAASGSFAMPTLKPVQKMQSNIDETHHPESLSKPVLNKITEEEQPQDVSRNNPIPVNIEPINVGSQVKLSMTADKTLIPKISQQSSNPEPPAKVARTWTDRSGTFKVEATLLGIADGKILLHKTNGVKIGVPFEKMSQEDVEYIESVSGQKFYVDFGKVTSPIPPTPVIQQSIPLIQTPVVPPTTYNGFDWYRHFLSCGIESRDCERYAQKFVVEKMDQAALPMLNRQMLKDLGVVEGDVIRLLNSSSSQYSNEKQTTRQSSTEKVIAKLPIPSSQPPSINVDQLDLFANVVSSGLKDSIQAKRAEENVSAAKKLQEQKDELLAKELQEKEIQNAAASAARTSFSVSIPQNSSNRSNPGPKPARELQSPPGIYHMENAKPSATLSAAHSRQSSQASFETAPSPSLDQKPISNIAGMGLGISAEAKANTLRRGRVATGAGTVDPNNLFAAAKLYSQPNSNPVTPATTTFQQSGVTPVQNIFMSQSLAAPSASAGQQKISFAPLIPTNNPITPVAVKVSMGNENPKIGVAGTWNQPNQNIYSNLGASSNSANANNMYTPNLFGSNMTSNASAAVQSTYNPNMTNGTINNIPNPALAQSSIPNQNFGASQFTTPNFNPPMMTLPQMTPFASMQMPTLQPMPMMQPIFPAGPNQPVNGDRYAVFRELESSQGFDMNNSGNGFMNTQQIPTMMPYINNQIPQQNTAFQPQTPQNIGLSQNQSLKNNNQPWPH